MTAHQPLRRLSSSRGKRDIKQGCGGRGHTQRRAHSHSHILCTLMTCHVQTAFTTALSFGLCSTHCISIKPHACWCSHAVKQCREHTRQMPSTPIVSPLTLVPKMAMRTAMGIQAWLALCLGHMRRPASRESAHGRRLPWLFCGHAAACPLHCGRERVCGSEEAKELWRWRRWRRWRVGGVRE